MNHLSRSEKEALVRAFIPDQADDLPIQHHSEISINNDTSVGVLAAEIETSNMEIDLTNELTSETIENVTENPSTTKEEEEEVSEEQSHLISQFCEMTGKDPAYAKNILEVPFFPFKIVTFAFNLWKGDFMECGNSCFASFGRD